MFDAIKVKEAYKNLLGWEQHYDTTDINLPATITDSESEEFYQQKHPALNVANVRACLPQGETLNEYLPKVVGRASVEIFNDLLQYRQLSQYAKTLLNKSTLLNRLGLNRDGIVNQGRFVGLHIQLKAETGVSMILNEIGLQFQNEETFNMYLFHTSKDEPIDTFEVTTSANSSWKWEVKDIVLNANKTGEYYGGAFVLGYYQDDLTGSAVNMKGFDWKKGECGTCNKNRSNNWNSIKRYAGVFPIYVPQGSYVQGKMFDVVDDAFFSPHESYGLNLRMTIKCDLTDFFILNKMVFKNLLALKVTLKVLTMMKFSQETNYIEENLKMMIIRDLEGDKETNAYNISQQYRYEIKSVKFNIDGINSSCLPCESQVKSPKIGNV